MTFSPELEAKFAKMIGNYPPGRQKGALIPMLLYAQDEVGAVTEEVIEEVAKRLKLSRVEVEEVLGYYTMLTREPRGRYHIQICTNISCMLTGGEELFEHACRRLGIGNKGKTPDGQFSLEEVECLGACSWAPAMQVNYEFHYQMTPEKFDRLIESLRKLQ
ncbi:MAG: NAD(P)H-dependent oxidoreductase subunit E [Bryobacteraceae bacterium]|nr:NAD(P)H-dependent oxidoreductase subunit E [Bryobacteraceae bacterium]MCX7602936.1 NAD(P)H-dependent oxidoreductase subunit E [Bryobacteraceae bacterium]